MSDQLAPEQIGVVMHQLVPLVATLNLEYGPATPNHATVTLRDQPQYRNHVGGPHAALMFGVAESATGAAAIAAFGDMFDRAVLLPVTATIDFLSIALGDLTATASLQADPAAVRAEFESGKRPEFKITAEIANSEGKVTGRVTTIWTLKALRQQP
jgi:acyl-coenzyme A thioesterase PaaI-like protein